MNNAVSLLGAARLSVQSINEPFGETRNENPIGGSGMPSYGECSGTPIPSSTQSKSIFKQPDKIASSTSKMSKQVSTQRCVRAKKSVPHESPASAISQRLETESAVENLNCCNFQFSKLSNYKRHISRKHMHNTETVCPVCGKLFRYKDNMLKHQKIHKNKTKKINVKQNLIKKRNLFCEKCKAKFTKNSSLIRHIKSDYNSIQ